MVTSSCRVPSLGRSFKKGPSKARPIVGSAVADDALTKLRRFRDSGSDWTRFVGTLFLTGSISGPLLDSIHSQTQLQIYDSLPIDITSFGLDFHSSLWVSPLLGVFYDVLGTLHPLADSIWGDERRKPQSWGMIGLSFGVLALGIEISALMYENGVAYSSIHFTLAAFALLNWVVFERTSYGFILAAICAFGAPFGELPILLWLKWWHYSRPDVFGLLPSWVIWCYFFYTPAVGNLARKLWRQMK